jgi:hypothetical protein
MNGDSYQVIRAIRGPITVITIGVLFALQNFTRFGFDQTWPVLLIVFGLLSLMQRGASPSRTNPSQPFPPPPPPRGYASTSYAGSHYSKPPDKDPSTPAPGSGSSPSGGAL